MPKDNKEEAGSKNEQANVKTGTKPPISGGNGSTNDVHGKESTQESNEAGQKVDKHPVAVYTHPEAEGARLIHYGDGTVTVVDSAGNASKRVQYDIGWFTQRGWGINSPEEKK